MIKELTYDTVIVGAGASGLYAALKLPKEQKCFSSARRIWKAVTPCWRRAVSAYCVMKMTMTNFSKIP